MITRLNIGLSKGRRINLAVLAVGVLAAVAFAFGSGHLEILRGAVGAGDSADGLERLITASNRLMTPALVAAGAVFPLAVIAGGFMVMVGNKKGAPVIAMAFAALVLIASANGLAA